jgi:rhodanese-related sulfurtransferase
MTCDSITPAALYDLMRTGKPVDLIDVREPDEFATVHAVGARPIPLNTISKDRVLADRLAAAGQPIYVICKSGGRSSKACARLIEEGLDHVVNVEGGTTAWEKAGLPVERSSGPGGGNWVRTGGIVAVVAGLILGATVNPVFAYAAAAVWLILVLTGNGPCCASGTCSTATGKTSV